MHISDPRSQATWPQVGAAFVACLTAPFAALHRGLARLFARRPPPDAEMEAALDQLLAHDSTSLRGRTNGNPLDFRPSEHVRPNVYGIGWTPPGGRVEIVRTVRAATERGYRVRLRAFARGAKGRLLVRSVEVDLQRAK